MLPSRWFWAIGFSAFCVLVECVLNAGGLLVWEYPFWNLSFGGVWLILVVGYFEFFAAINLVLWIGTRGAKARRRSKDRGRGPAFWRTMTGLQRQLTVVGVIYAVPVLMNVFGFAIMRWTY